MDVKVKPHGALGGRAHLWTVVDITDAEIRYSNSSPLKTKTRGITMPKFVIEREIPERGRLSSEQLRAISRKSCEVLREMGAQIQWVQSYVTDDKIYCIYVAPDEDAVRKHAQQGGFPANRISRIRSVIDPTTAE
jgi:hypothetical protein